MGGNENLTTKKIMNLLSYRDHTERELFDKLMRAGFQEEESKEAIQLAKIQGYINDERYAEHYIGLNQERKSKNHIYRELENRGVKKEIIEKMMGEYVGEEIALVRAMNKKIKQLGEPLTMEKVIKLKAYLYRQGYQKDRIYKNLQPYI